MKYHAILDRVSLCDTLNMLVMIYSTPIINSLPDCLRDDEGSCSESKDYFEKYLGDDIEEDGCQHDENGLCLEDDGMSAMKHLI